MDKVPYALKIETPESCLTLSARYEEPYSSYSALCWPLWALHCVFHLDTRRQNTHKNKSFKTKIKLRLEENVRVMCTQHTEIHTGMDMRTHICSHMHAERK